MSSQKNSTAWRNGYKWSVNECLRLEREYDLLHLSVPEMAALHNRTNNAIICKLQQEGLADYNELYIQTYGNETVINDLTYSSLLQVDVSVDDEDDEYVPKLIDNDDDDDSSSSEDEEDVNEYYLAEQVKTLQKQMSFIMAYLTNSKGVNHLQSSA